MIVFVTYKERDENNSRELDIIAADLPTQVDNGILIIWGQDGDVRKIPLANVHKWKERSQ